MDSVYSVSHFEAARRLSNLRTGTRGTVARVLAADGVVVSRLEAFGVTPGAVVVVLQTFPGVVFRCDETELAIEKALAHLILIHVLEGGVR